jgi:hypothetical protein
MNEKPLRLSDLERFTSFEPAPFDAVSFAWYGHVPQVDVTAVERLGMPFGVVTALTFDEWVRLEGLNAWDWASYFGAQQTFAGGAFQEERSSSDLPLQTLVRQAGHSALQFWLLAATTFDTFVVHPNVSSGYSSCRGKDGRLRILRARGIGELECLRLPTRITVLPEHQEVLGRNSALIDGVWQSDLAPIVNTFSSVFSRTISHAGLRDVWLDFVSQLELFLNPRGDGPLGRTFSERLASMCALTPEELPEYRDVGKAMYQYRSEILHGKRADIARAAAIMDRHYPFPSTILRRCVELMACVCSGEHSPQLSPDLLLSGDRAFLTEAYLALAPARLQPIASSPIVSPELDDAIFVDQEFSLPPVSGPDAEARVKAALAALGARAKDS